MPFSNGDSARIAELVRQSVAEAMQSLPNRPTRFPLHPGGARGGVVGGGWQREDNWQCPRTSCRFSNFASRKACKVCGLSRHGTQATRAAAAQPKPTANSGGGHGQGRSSSKAGGGGASANPATNSRGRQPVLLAEFVRPPRGEAADGTASSSSVSRASSSARTTWADISEEDGETIVGKDNATVGQAQHHLPEGAAGRPSDSDEGPPAPGGDRQARLSELRAALKALQQQGIRAGTVVDSVQRDIDTLEKETADAKAKGEPNPHELVRAQSQFKKATAARAKLDTELDELYERFREEVDKKAAAIDAAEERVARSAAKLAAVKAALGNTAPSREAGDKIRGCAEKFKGIGPVLGEVLDVFLAEPSLQAHAAKVQQLRAALNGLADDTTDAARLLAPLASQKDPSQNEPPSEAKKEVAAADNAVAAAPSPASQPTLETPPPAVPTPPPPTATNSDGSAQTTEPRDQTAATTTRASRKADQFKGTASALVDDARKGAKAKSRRLAGGATAPMPVSGAEESDDDGDADDDPMGDADGNGDDSNL